VFKTLPQVTSDSLPLYSYSVAILWNMFDMAYENASATTRQAVRHMGSY
jgi:hypothetical protein